MNKIVVIQYGLSEVFPLLSLVIGLKKAYPNSHLIWAGEAPIADLVRYNKRIKRFIDINREFSMRTLQIVFGAQICVNTSREAIAQEFASNVHAHHIYGFDKNGPQSCEAAFFEKIMNKEICTRKTALQLYYDLAELKWRGEGYGLSYYPRTKQTKSCGSYLQSGKETKDCPPMKMPQPVLSKLDTLNKYAKIVTDDIFSAHASIALRKRCTFIKDLPYQMEFFGKGTLKKTQ